MSDAFSDTQQSFAHRIKDGRVCHTLLPTLNKFEKVFDSPTQRRELKTVKRLRLLPGVTTLFRDFTGGLSLVPLITFYSVESFIAGVRKTQGNISKAFIYQK